MTKSKWKLGIMAAFIGLLIASLALAHMDTYGRNFRNLQYDDYDARESLMERHHDDMEEYFEEYGYPIGMMGTNGFGYSNSCH